MAIGAKIYSVGRKAARILGVKTQSVHKAARKLGIRPDRTASFAGSLNDVHVGERSRTAMHRAFYESAVKPVHKWRHYLDIYDRFLRDYRGKPVSILEIGVMRGGSLAMWRRYFGEDAKIFGIDIDAECVYVGGTDAEVRIGSQADSTFL